MFLYRYFSFLEVFGKLTKDSSRQRSYSLENTQIYLDQKRSYCGQILVRFLGKIGQIVSQIFREF